MPLVPDLTAQSVAHSHGAAVVKAFSGTAQINSTVGSPLCGCRSRRRSLNRHKGPAGAHQGRRACLPASNSLETPGGSRATSPRSSQYTILVVCRLCSCEAAMSGLLHRSTSHGQTRRKRGRFMSPLRQTKTSIDAPEHRCGSSGLRDIHAALGTAARAAGGARPLAGCYRLHFLACVVGCFALVEHVIAPSAVPCGDEREREPQEGRGAPSGARVRLGDRWIWLRVRSAAVGCSAPCVPAVHREPS